MTIARSDDVARSPLGGDVRSIVKARTCVVRWFQEPQQHGASEPPTVPARPPHAGAMTHLANIVFNCSRGHIP
jgi:hypothetical protein